MRISEWIQGGFAIILAVAAWLRRLPVHRRRINTILAVIALIAIDLARLSTHILTPLHSTILRDWLAVALLLIPYWQTGQFFLGPNERFQSWLIRSDITLLKPIAPIAASMGRSQRLAMEYAYLSCYPLSPLGLAALYAIGHRTETDTYWFLVLVPTYLCYGITPFFPALPPRSLPAQQLAQQLIVPTGNIGRSLNLQLLKYGSIQAISFPSAHAASSLAIALVLLHFDPFFGTLFLAVAISIGIAAILGGYHYAIDILLGYLVALLVYAAWILHLVPAALIPAP
jgi:membrane-associated phospholipid phosphatase